MFQHSDLAPAANATVPTAPLLADKCWFSVHFYKPSVIRNGPLFIVLSCCVLGHHSLPNNRWKCGFIWVINYVLPLCTASACFSSAFSHPCALLVKDSFLPLSSTNESLDKLRKKTEFVLELCGLSHPGRRHVLKSWLGVPAIPVRLEHTLSSICL